MTTPKDASPPAGDGAGAYRLVRPLVLVGLMGAGKTSVGRRLAARLAVPFRDSDHEVEAAAGMSVADIFQSLGEPAFRDGERKVIARLLSEGPGVLATGGGAFMDQEVRDAIAASGVSVWLKADLGTLWNRVRDRGTRPLLKTTDPKGVLKGLMDTRYPTYAEADITVISPAGITHDDMVRRVRDAVLAYSSTAAAPALIAA